MIRWILRLTAFPVVLVLTILEWCGSYIVCFAGMLCKLLAGMIFLWVVIGFLTGLGSGEQITKMLAVGFGIFLVPQVGAGILRSLMLIRNILLNLSKSSSSHTNEI